MGKGSNFEREICTRLSQWWRPGRDDIFWRSSNSGGRATVRGKTGRGTAGQYGDIAATDPIGKPLLDLFSIELKRGYSDRFRLNDLLDNGPDQARRKTPTHWEAFILQAMEAARNAKSISWMLLSRRDRHVATVCFPMRVYRDLIMVGAGLGDAFPTVKIRPRLASLPGRQDLYLFATTLDQFLALVRPVHVREYVRDARRD